MTSFAKKMTIALVASAASALMTSYGEARPRNLYPSSSVAVVLTQPGDVNIATIELYRASRLHVQETGTWLMAPPHSLVKFLRPDGAKYGGLPVVPRAALAAAERRGRSTLPRLQEALDTMALSGAIIVDCVPDGDKVKECRMLYYDRARRKILASAHKSFGVAIADPSGWAPTLVTSLKGGLDARQSLGERNALKDLMASEKQEREQINFQMGLGLFGEAQKANGIDARNVPVGQLALGIERDGSLLGLEVGYGSSVEGSATKKQTMEIRSIGVGLDATSKALEMLIWNLGFSAGISERRLLGAESEDSIKSIQPYVTVRPGMLFDFKNDFSMGMNLRYSFALGGKTEAEGRFANAGFDSTSFGLGLVVRKVF